MSQVNFEESLASLNINVTSEEIKQSAQAWNESLKQDFLQIKSINHPV